MNKKILILSILFFNNNVFADNVVYKFLDDKGNVYYSDSIQPNQSSKYEVLSGKTGVLKKIVDDDLTKNKQIENDKQKVDEKTIAEQKRKDNSLLASYSSVDEINRLKDFEISQINQSIKNQLSSITDLKDRITEQTDLVESNSKNTKLQDKLNDLKSKLNDANNILENNKKLLETRTKKYDDDIKRFKEIQAMIKEKELNKDNSN